MNLFLFLSRQVGTYAQCHFSSHTDGFAQGWVWVDGFTDIGCITAHFNRQADFTDHIAAVRTDDTATDDAAGFSIKNQLGKTIVATVGNCTAGSSPWEVWLW